MVHRPAEPAEPTVPEDSTSAEDTPAIGPTGFYRNEEVKVDMPPKGFKIVRHLRSDKKK